MVRRRCSSVFIINYTQQHLLVQSHQYKHQNNVGNLFKLTLKTPERLH